MLILLGIAFLAGIVTALSPCVLPVLPILLVGGATGTSRRRPLAIVAGLVGSFTVFTLAGTALLDALGLPDDALRNLALALLFLLAATLIFAPVARLVERPFYRLTRRRVNTEGNGIVLGASLGLVFVPCAGPVFAAVASLAATGDVGLRVVLLTLAYAVGAALPMLAILLGSQKLAGGVAFLRREAPRVRVAAGIVLALTALAIAEGWDQRFTTSLPGYTQAFQDHVESSSVAKRELHDLRGGGEALAAAKGPAAPDFVGISGWLNTPRGKPLTLQGLRGKVVLVDFWTYSCINCLRTLPHLEAWDARYRKDGLVIVGVHTPEFAFEHVPSNVRTAVKKLGVRYPVALDNKYGTWSAYHNEYWPAEYLIDRTGHVRHTHFGEGEYPETEKLIRQYLGRDATQPMTEVADTTPDHYMTPESYLGYGRIERYPGRLVFDRYSTYRFPADLAQDDLAYSGTWKVEEQRIVSGPFARLRLRFLAQKIHLVLGGRGTVEVVVDGKPLRSVAIRGEPRLYTLARFPEVRTGLLELRFSQGISGYAFTFG
jgi:cytochrome c biogenesis protein CcdA/thiol-disulfide isomerase/thioredoxin